MIVLAVLLHISMSDCAVIKSKIHEHGKAAAIAWALTQGYGWRDILMVRRKCKV